MRACPRAGQQRPGARSAPGIVLRFPVFNCMPVLNKFRRAKRAGANAFPSVLSPARMMGKWKCQDSIACGRDIFVFHKCRAIFHSDNSYVRTRTCENLSPAIRIIQCVPCPAGPPADRLAGLRARQLAGSPASPPPRPPRQPAAAAVAKIWGIWESTTSVTSVNTHSWGVGGSPGPAASSAGITVSTQSAQSAVCTLGTLGTGSTLSAISHVIQRAAHYERRRWRRSPGSGMDKEDLRSCAAQARSDGP